MISEDVIHSFYVPAFRVKQDVLPGRYSSLWFEPTKAGEYRLFCAEYCGTSHSRMIGRVIVQEPAAYAEWLQGGTSESPVEAGHRLYQTFRCDTCHDQPTTPRCPPLTGIFGRTVELSDGSSTVADDAYLRQSILDPSADVVAGYQGVMPSYRGQLGEEGILQIITYLKSLSPPPQNSRSRTRSSHEVPDTPDEPK